MKFGGYFLFSWKNLKSNVRSGVSTPSDPTLAELEALHALIGSSISQIKYHLASTDDGHPFPSLNTPFSPASEIPRSHPTVMDASSRIIAAAYQMIATVRPPGLSIMISSMQYYIPAAIKFAIDAHIPEIIREAGQDGAHVKDISYFNGADPQKIGRILRFLASSHVFLEVSPDVFRHNRISTLLDTGKSVAGCIADPIGKHINSSGIPALVLHLTTHGLSSATEISSALLPLNETLTTPGWSSGSTVNVEPTSAAPNETPFNLAYNTNLPFFEWMGEKDLEGGTFMRENDAKVFAMAMHGVRTTEGSLSRGVFEDFIWKHLPEGTVVIDVGGGVGAQALALAKQHKQLRFVIQDREEVIKAGKTYWATNLPTAIENGKVAFQVHDFFTAQPAIPFADKRAIKIFFVHHILHDWSDPYCVGILKHLRSAAVPGQETILIVGDLIIEYACDTSSELTQDGIINNMPKPLLANGGHAAALDYFLDMQMLNMLNGQERTILQLRSILQQAGWLLKKVYAHEVAGSKRFVVAVPN